MEDVLHLLVHYLSCLHMIRLNLPYLISTKL